MKKSHQKTSIKGNFKKKKAPKLLIIGGIILVLAIFVGFTYKNYSSLIQTASINKIVEQDPNSVKTNIERKAVEKLNKAANADAVAKTDKQKDKAAVDLYVAGQVVEDLFKMKDKPTDVSAITSLEKAAKDKLIKQGVFTGDASNPTVTAEYDYTKGGESNVPIVPLVPIVPVAPITTTSPNPALTIDPKTGKCVQGSFGCPYDVPWSDDLAQKCGGSVSGFYCYGGEFYVINIPATQNAAAKYFGIVQATLKNTPTDQLSALVNAQPGNTTEEKMDNYLKSLSILDKGTRNRLLTEYKAKILETPTKPPTEQDLLVNKAAEDKQKYESLKSAYSSKGGILAGTQGAISDAVKKDVAWYLQYEIDMAKADPKFVGEYQKKAAALSEQAKKLTATYDDAKCDGVKLGSGESCVYSGTKGDKKMYSIKPAGAVGVIVTASMDAQNAGKVTSVGLGKKYVEYQFGIGAKPVTPASIDGVPTTDGITVFEPQLRKIDANGNVIVPMKTPHQLCLEAKAKAGGGSCDDGYDSEKGEKITTFTPLAVTPPESAKEPKIVSPEYGIHEEGNGWGRVKTDGNLIQQLNTTNNTWVTIKECDGKAVGSGSNAACSEDNPAAPAQGMGKWISGIWNSIFKPTTTPTTVTGSVAFEEAYQACIDKQGSVDGCDMVARAATEVLEAPVAPTVAQEKPPKEIEPTYVKPASISALTPTENKALVDQYNQYRQIGGKDLSKRSCDGVKECVVYSQGISNYYLDAAEIQSAAEESKPKIDALNKYNEIIKMEPKAFIQNTSDDGFLDYGDYTTKGNCEAMGWTCIKVPDRWLYAYINVDTINNSVPVNYAP